MARGRDSFQADWTFSEIQESLPAENERYEYFHWFFHRKIPPAFAAHRDYFVSIANWCGEDAFHAMWFKLLNETRPSKALEIGVHRGQTLSLMALTAREGGWETDIWGLSPLDGSGDGVSAYAGSAFDYRADIDKNFRHFGLPEPQLFQAYSQDPEAIAFIGESEWDLIYVDGSHDLEVVCSDIGLAVRHLRPGGTLVLDDASLARDYRPYSFSFAGHPGPSRAAATASIMRGFREIGTCGHNRIFRRLVEGSI
jgi:SAM-dependent methyltransferase